MSLLITNKSTHKQQLILKKLEYFGTGKYVAENLSVAEATEIIDGLFAERQLADKETIHYL